MPNGIAFSPGNFAQLRKPSSSTPTHSHTKTSAPSLSNTTDTVGLGNTTDNSLAQADKLRAMSRGFGSKASGNSSTMLVHDNSMLDQISNGRNRPTGNSSTMLVRDRGMLDQIRNGTNRPSGDSATMRIRTNAMLNQF